MVISRYLFFQFFKAVCGSLMFALVLYLTLTYMEESQHYFPSHSVSLKTLFLYYYWQLPTIITLLLPFSVLIGGIVSNWVLAKNGEIAALRAAGMSMLKISIPMLFVGIFFTLFQFYLNEFVVPVTATKFNYLKANVVENKHEGQIFNQSQWLRTKTSVMHYKKYIETKQLLLEPEIFVFHRPGMVSDIVHAKVAHFDRQMHTWVLTFAEITHFDENAFIKNIEMKDFYYSNIDFPPPKVLKQESDSSQLSYWELRRLIYEAHLAGHNESDRIVDLQMKLSGPVANLLFVFLVLPFALKKERQEDNYFGILICLLVAIIYWFGNLSLRNLAIKGFFNPFVAAWATSLLLGILCFLFVRKLDEGQ